MGFFYFIFYSSFIITISCYDWKNWYGNIGDECVSPQNCPSDSNVEPGSRFHHIGFQTLKGQKNGKMYFWGGMNIGELTDEIFEYSFIENEWSLYGGYSGSTTPKQYGDIGVTQENNLPYPRRGTASWVKDDIVYFFGGDALDSYHNDLWTFDMTSRYWTWIKGSNQGNSNSFQVGERKVFHNNYDPIPRKDPAYFTTPSNKFIIFGGYCNNAVIYQCNDLWIYDPELNGWAYWLGNLMNFAMEGRYTADYGEEPGCVYSDFFPGSRTTSIGWATDDKNFYIFGGVGLDQDSSYGFLNDLWLFNDNIDCWVWLGGSNNIQITTLSEYQSGTLYPALSYSTTIHDADRKDFYIFGGRTSIMEYSNLIFKFNSESKKITIVPDTSEKPCGRIYNQIAMFNFSSKDFWNIDEHICIFGGSGYCDPNLGTHGFNDLWCVGLDISNRSVIFYFAISAGVIVGAMSILSAFLCFFGLCYKRSCKQLGLVIFLIFLNLVNFVCDILWVVNIEPESQNIFYVVLSSLCLILVINIILIIVIIREFSSFPQYEDFHYHFIIPYNFIIFLSLFNVDNFSLFSSNVLNINPFPITSQKFNNKIHYFSIFSILFQNIPLLICQLIIFQNNIFNFYSLFFYLSTFFTAFHLLFYFFFILYILIFYTCQKHDAPLFSNSYNVEKEAYSSVINEPINLQTISKTSSANSEPCNLDVLSSVALSNVHMEMRTVPAHSNDSLWKEFYTDEGEKYYYNTQTGESRWQL